MSRILQIVEEQLDHEIERAEELKLTDVPCTLRAVKARLLVRLAPRRPVRRSLLDRVGRWYVNKGL